MKRTTRWALRLAAVATMLAGLTGPAPGNVGGCGAGTQTANAATHCRDRRFWLCRRDHFAGRIDDAEFAACLQPIEEGCQGASWPPGCMPTPSQSEACIMLLQRGDLATLTNEQLLAMYPDCQLCSP